MRSLSVVGVWVFEFLANHRLSGIPKKCGSVRIGDDPTGTQKGASFPLDECIGLKSTIEDYFRFAGDSPADGY
jgi:hypothetical protein